jgi:predicted RNA-binding Zn-ribbon protein involved in translation (DUF1610 family)
MVELADIFHQYGPEYRAKFGSKMLPSHLRAMKDIEWCRTQTMGAHVYLCQDCGQIHYRYHSCQNRNCPKCMNDRAEIWLQKQKELLLPTPYHLTTFTVPQQLRSVARSNQKLIYSMLFATSAAALQKLAGDPRFIGAKACSERSESIGMAGILHTWTRDMRYHPHVHYIVPGGGFDPETGRWKPSSKKFLLPVLALSAIFRAKFRDELKKTDLYDSIDPYVWKKDWIVHSKPVGNGQHALKYLASYLYRVAISNNRIIKLRNHKVTFKYRDPDTGKWKLATLLALEFIRRFLQHVLPEGFTKACPERSRRIRYYGFLSPRHKDTLSKIKALFVALFLLLLHRAPTHPDDTKEIGYKELICPNCGGRLRLIAKINGYRRRGPP